MADRTLNEISSATDFANAYTEDASGNQVKISKADMASVLAGVRTIKYYKSSNPTISIPNAAGKVFMISHQNAYCAIYTVIAEEIHRMVAVGSVSNLPSMSMNGTTLEIDLTSVSYSFAELTMIKDVQ